MKGHPSADELHLLRLRFYWSQWRIAHSTIFLTKTTVNMPTALHARHFEVEIDEDVVQVLQTKARQQGVSIGYLASDLLRQQLQVAA